MTEVAARLTAQFQNDVVASGRTFEQDWILVEGDSVKAVLRALRSPEHGGFDFLVDLAGVDLLNYGPSKHRFEVVYHLRSMASGRRIRVKAAVKEAKAEVDSVVDFWKCANWFEREVFDMFGVRFRGHPNLKRILTHHRFVGHALRKDYFVKDQQWLDGDPESLLDEIGSFGENPADGGFSELIPINIGPAHPAMHGTLRIFAKLDGETIVKCAQEIGYLHRAFEKHSEVGTWTQVVPYTDRLNYCSAMTNNVAYCRAVEKLLGVEVPDRTKFIRIIVAEINRIIDHLVCVAASLVDLGALTNFWYCFALREQAYEALEGLCGARLTSSYVRIGGVSDDLDPAFVGRIRQFLKDLPNGLNDVLSLVKKNRIFLDRTKGIGVISGEDALSYGYTGPCLRASGVGYDVRKAEPYDGYDTFDFDVPVYHDGDTYSRLMIRFDEMIQSARIIEQALDRLPAGPIFTADRRVSMANKPEVYTTIEALMNHFMLIYEGIKVPRGETYSFLESPNGELGFYVMSDGSGRPYRVRVRPPCFPIFSSVPLLIEGGMLADAVAVVGSLNIIAGELDR